VESSENDPNCFVSPLFRKHLVQKDKPPGIDALFTRRLCRKFAYGLFDIVKVILREGFVEALALGDVRNSTKVE
jgi:hypothetical protein